jgi:hypothetical protein
LNRRDDIFFPLCWLGAANVAIDIATATNRAKRLIMLAQNLEAANHVSQLSDFDDLLFGLPSLINAN